MFIFASTVVGKYSCEPFMYNIEHSLKVESIRSHVRDSYSVAALRRRSGVSLHEV